MIQKSIINTLEKITDDLVEFFITIGKQNDMNEKFTTIFAYIQIYGELTQSQLEELTGFALSTVSTSLKSLLEINVITKNKSTTNRTYYYTPTSDEVLFLYNPFSQILEKLLILEKFLHDLEKKMKSLSISQEEKDFFSKRLNSIYNYIEIQRRVIKNEKKQEFRPEFLQVDKLKGNLFEYSAEMKKLEENLINFVINNNLLSYIDAIEERIRLYFATRAVLTQDLLIDLTNYSRSMISRKLKEFRKNASISFFPKEYHQPRYYYLKSFSLGITKSILNSDQYIFHATEGFWKVIKQLMEMEIEGNQTISKLLPHPQQIIRFLQRLKVAVINLKKESEHLRIERSKLESFLED